MTTQIKTGYKVDIPPVMATSGNRIYITNDFDRVQVWNGVWAASYDAGIAAPSTAMGTPSESAGNVTIGVHLIRYRYLDSTSPGGSYRSNPSTAVSHTVSSSAKRLTFDIGTSGTDIIRSTDSKVDTIQIEATAAGGTEYYVVGTVANGGVSSFDYNISDTTLTAGDPAIIYDEFGHEQPPLGSVIAECRGYMFIGGAHARTISCGVTNGDATVTSSAAFSSNWVGRQVRFGSETTTYTVASVTDSSNLELSVVYAGSTATINGVFYSKNPNRIYWSKAQFPESWRAASRVRDVLSGSGDYLVGMAAYQGDLYLCGRRSIERLVFTDAQTPSAGELNRIAGEFGIWNHRCLYAMDGALYGWGPNGAWILTGGRPRWLSRDIDTTVAALLTESSAAKFHATYDPTEKVLRWHFDGDGNGTIRYAMAYDLSNGNWMIDRWRQGITAGATYATATGSLKLGVSDDTNSRVFTMSGATDGVPAGSTGDYTVGNSSSTTVTNITGSSLPTGTGTDLSKLIIYQPSSGEERVITSNTTSAITHAAFTTACSAGEKVYVGAIPTIFETTWAVMDGQEDKKRPGKLWIKMVPSSAGTARIYLYKDYSSTPLTWTKQTSMVDPKYLTITNGLTYAELSLTSTATDDGFVSVPMPADWARSWKAKIEVLSPAGTLRILDVQFAMERPGSKKVQEE